jgi:SNF2 family DNA or RNA helicase
MEPKQAKAYADMKRVATAELRNGMVTAVGVLATLTRLRQFACSYAQLSGPRQVQAYLPSNKYDWISNFLSEREGFDGKVIIASQFTGLLKLFEADLRKRGYDPLMLTGETSDRGRYDFQAKIQDPSDPHWIGLINTRAGGEAITLDQADDMILVDPPWIDDEVRQVEDRLHRISRIHQVTVYRLLSRGTIEQDIACLTDQQRADMMSLRPAGRKILQGVIDGV